MQIEQHRVLERAKLIMLLMAVFLRRPTAMYALIIFARDATMRIFFTVESAWQFVHPTALLLARATSIVVVCDA
jgi:hypothetical protein